MTVSFTPEWFRKLDTVVKMGLLVFLSAFGLIWGGMYLTRPDRTIPPYSVGSQEGITVAMHVPAWTSDTEIETLLYRFQKEAHGGRDFGRMKIQPTTKGDPIGHYQRMTVFVFANDHMTEADVLHRYLATESSRDQAEQAFRADFEKTVRGYYRLDGLDEEAWVGRIYEALQGRDTAGTAAYARQLFKGSVTEALGSPSPSSLAPSGKPAPPAISPF
ncbi:MAG: hypothetical protein ACKOBZ_05915 [Nitrospira sp.]